MDLSTYEMFVGHPDMQARFIFQAKFDHGNEEQRRTVAKFAIVADRYFKKLSELGFKLSRCTFDIAEQEKLVGVESKNQTQPIPAHRQTGEVWNYAN